MSDTPAADEADSGRRDSAYSLHGIQDPPVRSLATLSSGEVYPLIDHHAWGSQDESPDFHNRVAVAAYLPAQAPDVISECSESLDGDSSSMALTLGSRTSFATGSGCRTPSLGSYPSAPSKSSVSTWEADSAIGAGPIDEDGNFVTDGPSPAVQRPDGIECLFSFLGCNRRFLSAVTWHDHSKSHFHGAKPPKSMQCPYDGCAWSTQAPSGDDAWAASCTHLICEHEYSTLVSGTLWKKPDTAMIQHLYSARIIGSSQYQELRKYGRLGVDSTAYTMTDGEEKHRRRNRRPTVAARR